MRCLVRDVISQSNQYYSDCKEQDAQWRVKFHHNDALEEINHKYYNNHFRERSLQIFKRPENKPVGVWDILVFYHAYFAYEQFVNSKRDYYKDYPKQEFVN